MDFGAFFGSFNRYWLRYGPNTALVLVMILDAFPSVRSVARTDSINALIVVGVAAGVQYVFTWPLLLAHAFRCPPETTELLANKREQAAYLDLMARNPEWHKAPDNAVTLPEAKASGVEVTKSFAHLREHGNAVFCVATTFLQVGAMLNLLASHVTAKVGLWQHWPIGLAASVVSFTGAIVWWRATSGELERLAKIKVTGLRCSLHLVVPPSLLPRTFLAFLWSPPQADYPRVFF